MRVCKLLAVTLILGLLIATLPGCGQRVSKVKGTVTFKDKPLVFGSVVLMADKGASFRGEIQPDGTFQVEGVPPGTYRVSVTSPDPNSPAPAPAPTSSGNQLAAPKVSEPPQTNDNKTEQPKKPKKNSLPGWFPIPEKYSRHDQSGLSITVDGPDVTSDIKLKD